MVLILDLYMMVKDFLKKNIVKAFLDLHLECTTPKRLLKYTTGCSLLIKQDNVASTLRNNTTFLLLSLTHCMRLSSIMLLLLRIIGAKNALAFALFLVQVQWMSKESAFLAKACWFLMSPSSMFILFLLRQPIKPYYGVCMYV